METYVALQEMKTRQKRGSLACGVPPLKLPKHMSKSRHRRREHLGTFHLSIFPFISALTQKQISIWDLESIESY